MPTIALRSMPAPVEPQPVTQELEIQRPASNVIELPPEEPGDWVEKLC